MADRGPRCGGVGGAAAAAIVSAVIGAAAVISASPARAQCSATTQAVAGSYTFNDEPAPPLRLLEGVQYRFTFSGVPSLHPLIFTTDALGGSPLGELTAAQLPGYSPGGHCSTCGTRRVATVTPGPNTPDSFFYQCTVHAGLGNQVTIVRRPTIVLQPTDAATCVGGSATFTIEAAAGASASLAYQWRRNLVDIAGATGPQLTIAGATPGDAASYDCVVTNHACASVQSVAAALVLCPADLDDGTGTGSCDGGVDISDLIFYLGLFGAGDLRADLDDGSATGTPDGGVTIADLLYYLTRFEGGC